jgi:hypothetical protein
VEWGSERRKGLALGLGMRANATKSNYCRHYKVYKMMICVPNFYVPNLSADRNRERNLCPRAIFFFVNQLTANSPVTSSRMISHKVLAYHLQRPIYLRSVI